MGSTKEQSEGEAPQLPPVDPAALERAARKVMGKPKPEGGWKKRRGGKGAHQTDEAP